MRKTMRWISISLMVAGTHDIELRDSGGRAFFQER